MTILPQLERDLFNAAEERLRPDATAPHRRSAPPESSFRARFGRAGAGLPVILSVAVAVAVAVVAVAVLGHGHQATRSTTASGPGGGSSRAELIRTLDVLRRPQTKSDLQGLERLDRLLKAYPKPRAGAWKQSGYGDLDRRLARVVNIHLPAWRATVLIAPIRSQPSPTSRERSESIHVVLWRIGTLPFRGSLILDNGPGHDDPPTSVGALLAHGLSAGTVVPGENPVSGLLHGPDVMDGVLLVPDGVASIKLGRFTLSNGLGGFSTKALKAALATLHGTATVHDNIAAFQLAIPVYHGHLYHWTGPLPFFGATVQNTWFDASGHLIRRTTTSISVTVRVEAANPARH